MYSCGVSEISTKEPWSYCKGEEYKPRNSADASTLEHSGRLAIASMEKEGKHNRIDCSRNEQVQQDSLCIGGVEKRERKKQRQQRKRQEQQRCEVELHAISRKSSED